MTNEEAIAVLEAIRAARDDDETAHSLEDRFRQRVLEAIVRGEGNHVALAAIALMTSDIQFSRWCR